MAPDPRPTSRGQGLDHDTTVIGAGISGLYQLYRLRELGQEVRVFEAGTGVGGTWYWNRYPGCRFDSESYSYGYSFSQELLDEWDWTEHFAPQPETERYLNHVADRFDLRRDIRFRSRVTAAVWDDAALAWEITLEDGRRSRSRYLVTAVGPLSAPTLPRIPGVDDFQGEAYHTGLWPKHPVSFEGKRVGVIGTGATGVQAISEIAKTAGHLTVFQRRPNWCTPLHNRPISRAEMDEIRKGYPALFQRCRETAACFLHNTDPRGTFEVSPEERQAFWETLYAAPGFAIWMGNFRDVLIDREANALFSAFVADKIRQRVKDPRVAELLIPKDHGFGTRRVPQETHYYEVYNQPNVELVSILETPIERITPDRRAHHGAGVRARHDRLRHRLRRHHRQLRPHRHPRARRAAAQGPMEGRPRHVHGRDGRRLPQPLHGDGPAHRARQHPAERRVQRGVDPRPARLPRAPRTSASPTRGRRRWRSGRSSSRRRARACSPTRSTPG